MGAEIREDRLAVADVKLNVTDRNGASHDLCATSGAVLMHVLRERVDLTLGTCGGAISCGTCLVRIDPAWSARLDPPGEDEAEMLEALGAEGPEERLSCQIVLDGTADGAALTISPEE